MDRRKGATTKSKTTSQLPKRGNHNHKGSTNESKNQEQDSKIDISEKVQALIADIDAGIIEHTACMIEADVNCTLIENFCDELRKADSCMSNLAILELHTDEFTENKDRKYKFQKLILDEINESSTRVNNALALVLRGDDEGCARGIENQKQFFDNNNIDQQMKSDIESKVRGANWGKNVFDGKSWSRELKCNMEELLARSRSLGAEIKDKPLTLVWSLYFDYRIPWIKVSRVIISIRDKHASVVKRLSKLKSKLNKIKNSDKAEKQKGKDLATLKREITEAKRRIKEDLEHLPENTEQILKQPVLREDQFPKAFIPPISEPFRAVILTVRRYGLQRGDV